MYYTIEKSDQDGVSYVYSLPEVLTQHQLMKEGEAELREKFVAAYRKTLSAKWLLFPIPDRQTRMRHSLNLQVSMEETLKIVLLNASRLKGHSKTTTGELLGLSEMKARALFDIEKETSLSLLERALGLYGIEVIPQVLSLGELKRYELHEVMDARGVVSD